MASITSDVSQVISSPPHVKVDLKRKLFVVIAATLVLSYTGPFGTYRSLTFLPRLAYWGIAVAGIGFIMNSMAYYSLRLTAVQRASPALRLAGWAVIGSIPATFVMLALGHVFLDPLERLGYFFPLYLKVLAINAVMCVADLRPLAKAKPKSAENADADPRKSAASKHAKFLHRLCGKIGGELISLSKQDHYLEVTTTQGRQLILEKISTVETVLADYPGVRVHRSHWVVTAHITKLQRQGSSYVVVLSDGRELPVSRTYLPAVRQAIGGQSA